MELTTAEGNICYKCIEICINNPTSDTSSTSSIGGGLSESIDLSVFPNPANDQLNIHFSTTKLSNSKPLIFEVIDIEGRIVMLQSMKYNKGVNQKTLDISSLSAGVYLLQIQGEKATQSVKFVKK